MNLFETNTASKDISRAVDEYLAEKASPRLHLGCGPALLPGWLNTDIEPASPAVMPLDASQRLPFPDRSLDRIFGEHLLEHLSYEDGGILLGESIRTLRPGGVLRLATPDLRQLARLLLDNLDETQQKYISVINAAFGEVPHSGDPCFTMNSSFYEHGHRFLYTPEVLSSRLRDYGFTDIAETVPMVSSHPDLCGLEIHGRLLGDERLNTYECMVFEASKPFD